MPPPLCRTLEEMRRLRCPPSPTPVIAHCPSHQQPPTAGPTAGLAGFAVPAAVALAIPANVVGTTQCLFFPYVCAQNRAQLHEWCRACTHRRLFPEAAATHCVQVCQTRPW